jgi:site-specific recombinase XerD
MPRLQSFPSLKRLEFLSPQSQDLVAAYLTHLQARQYAATTVQSTLDALKSFCVLLPATRQPCLYQDLTSTRAADVEAWLLAAHRKGLAPSTINHLLSVMHRFFGFLHGRGLVTQQPIHWRRHHVIVPQSLPKPMGEDALIQWFRVIERLRDRTMFLLMLRCGLRVGEVSALTWPSINFKAGSIRIDSSKGKEQLEQLFAQIQHPMDRALFLLMLRGGLRVSEVAQLKVRALDWSQQALLIEQGKGRKDRRVYLSADAVASLHACLQQRPSDVPGDMVFWNQKRPSRPLSVKAIQKKIQRYAKAAGIAASCHSVCVQPAGTRG